MTYDFKEIKAKKDGVVTPKSLLQSALNHIDDKEIIVVISIDNDGYVATGWSEGGSIRTLGLLEVAKTQLIEKMIE